MPLPWKNNNVPRISRIVADLQSPKRGGSLVVETGFPTSLIDLFVKNRSRFKRRKSKRLSDPILPPVPPAPPPSPPEYLSFDDGSTTVMRLVRETAHEAVAQSDRVIDGSGSGPAVFAILKILTAIVLTLSVKKLTVGIIMSAFALLFLEFVGKHIVCRLDFLKRRSNAITAFSSLSRGISCCFRKNCEDSSEQEGIIHEEEISGSGLVGGEVVEIEVVEPNYVDANNINLEATDSLNRDDEWICSEMKKDNFEISECTAKGKRCHKLKSKMMKILVPRKLRSSKEEKKEKKSKNKEAKSNSEKLKEHISVVPLLETTKDKDGGIICSRDSSMAKEVVALMSVSEEGRRRRRESESSGYVMLIVISLAGLGGGRILALVFIMAWCFILKLVRNRGRSVRTSFS